MNAEKARRIYLNLIEKAWREHGKPTNNNNTRQNLENHHIIPRAVHGTNHHDNRVFFTYKQHAFAHHLMVYLWGEMGHVWDSMSSNGSLTLRQVAAIREQAAQKAVLMKNSSADKKIGDLRHRSKLPRSGFRGVSVQNKPTPNPYFVVIESNGMRIPIGSYPNAKQAAVDYDIALLQLVGESTARNFPELSLIELRRINYQLRTKCKPQLEKVKKGYAWSEERKAAFSAMMKGKIKKKGYKQSAEHIAKRLASRNVMI